MKSTFFTFFECTSARRCGEIVAACFLVISSSSCQHCTPIHRLADMAVAAPAEVLLGGDSLLGAANGANPRELKSKRYLPHFNRNFKIAPRFGGKTDFIDIDGMESIEAVSCDWADKLVCKSGLGFGRLCAPAPVHFDFNNSAGGMSWGPDAQGALVVAIRGIISFDEMAHNAAEAGAVGLIIVDNEPKWKNSFQITTDTLKAPPVAAVLVAHKHAQLFCTGCNGANAQIMRRKSDLTKQQIATNMLKSVSPF